MSTKPAVTGFYEMPPTRDPRGLTPLRITADVANRAIADAGLEKGQIDGLLTGQTMGDGFTMLWPTVVVDYLGLDVRYMNTVENGGGSSTGMLWRACAAIEAGMCDHVLCVVGDVWDSKTLSFNPPPFPKVAREFDEPYGLVGATPGYAMLTRRHMHEFGTKPEQLAKIAVDQRKNAMANPTALYGNKAIEIEDVLNSRVICDPVHLLEVVSPCTGGGAFVVSRGDYAERGPNPPVRLLGAAEAGGNRSIIYATHAPKYTTSMVKRAADELFKKTGLSRSDMDFAQIYDCYTVVVLMTIEDAGFCVKGQSGAFAEDHDLTFAGDFPLNTHGGQLSFGQPGLGGGMTQVMEAIRQLMGRGEARQVKNATKGYVANGGIVGQHCGLILAN
ncbi:MAG: thiolase family protein [Gammaproteobacteria bacterium]|nr:thiolase family protein [Gammaproteobacteria bacterium]